MTSPVARSRNGTRTFVVLAVICVVALASPLLAWAFGFTFARAVGGSGTDQVLGVATDSAGNTYVTGLFSGTVDFDRTASSSGDTLTSQDSFDGFVLKLSPSGAFVWVRGFGGLGDDDGGAIAVDGSGNIYLTGAIVDSLTYYSSAGVLNPGALSVPVSNDAFILKLDSGGSLVWARGIGQASVAGTAFGHIDRGLGLALDGSGNVYVSGVIANYSSAEMYGPSGTIDSNIFPLAGDFGGYLVKLNASGALQWGRAFAGPGQHMAYGVAATSSNVYVTGSFQGTVDFDRSAVSAGDTLTAQGNSSTFVVNLTSSGSFSWARGMGGSTGDNAGSGIVVDSGGVYVVGTFDGTGDFDRTASSTGDTLTSSGELDVFVVKLETDGDFSWARRVGGSGFDQALGVATNGLGTLWVSGLVDGPGSSTFGPGAITLPGTSGGEFDAFRLQLSTDGDFVTAQVFGGTGDDQAFGIAMDSTGKVSVGGAFRGTVDVEPSGSLAGDTVVSQGTDDGFVVRLATDADLGVSVADGPDPVARGTALTYTITAQNIGPDPAETVTLSVPLPVGTTYSALTPAGGWNCTTPTVGTQGTVSCTVPTFAVGTATFTLSMVVDPSVTVPGNLTSTATIDAPTADPVSSNDSFNTSTAVIAAPVVVTTGTALAYTDGQGAVAVDPALTVTDADSPNLTGATVSITGGFVVAEDSLQFTTQNGISGSYTAGTGVLTLTGTTVVANYQTALRSVTYTNSSGTPTITARTVSFSATDGTTTGAPATRQITIAAVNTPPVNTVPSAQTTPANTPRTFSAIGANAISVADADAATADVQTTLQASTGTLTLAVGAPTGPLTSAIGSGTSTLVLVGSTAEITAALDGLIFTPPAGFSGNATLTVTTTDLGNTGPGGAQLDTDTVQIGVGALPTVSVNDPAAVAERDSGTPNSIVFAVTLSGPSNLTITIPYSTVDQTATGGAACTAGIDYITTAGTLTYTPGQTTQQITVPVCGDALTEGTETFRVDLGTPVNVAIADGQGVGTISDDDVAGTVSFNVESVQSPEGADSVTLTIDRSLAGTPSGTLHAAGVSTVTIQFQTVDGTAIAGKDYVATSGTLTFGPGETSKTITITLLHDDDTEGPETFTVVLFNPGGSAGIGHLATIVVTIVDAPSSRSVRPSKDDTDKPRRETEQERLQRERTNAASRDDIATEGNVIETRCGGATPAVVIANRDGNVEVRLIREAVASCSAIQVGDYLELDGEKQSEVQFDADEVTIYRNGKHVR